MSRREVEKLGLTVPEAGELLGICRGTAYKLARDGVLPALRLGRRLVVPRRALDRLLERPQDFGRPRERERFSRGEEEAEG
jgi:excisionase family DNA binding protein